MQPLYNTGEPRTDFYDIKMNVWIDGKSSLVFIVSSQTDNKSWTIKPYPWKEDSNAMRYVGKWTVKSENGNQDITKCSKTHNILAMLFSLGGYIGYHFHDSLKFLFYITSRRYNGEVQLLVSDKRAWWIEKFQQVLKGCQGIRLSTLIKRKKSIASQVQLLV